MPLGEAERGDRPHHGDERGPGEESIRAVLLRAASVLPFIVTGAIAAIAALGWVLIVVFGYGPTTVAIWEWAEGRSAWNVLSQVALSLLVLLVPLSIAGASVWAVNVGFGDVQPFWFWPVAEAFFGALLLGLVVGGRVAPERLEEYGFSGRNFWAVFAFLAFAFAVVWLRARVEKRERQAVTRGG
jgi:hypothetical protein